MCRLAEYGYYVKFVFHVKYWPYGQGDRTDCKNFAIYASKWQNFSAPLQRGDEIESLLEPGEIQTVQQIVHRPTCGDMVAYVNDRDEIDVASSTGRSIIDGLRLKYRYADKWEFSVAP